MLLTAASGRGAARPRRRFAAPRVVMLRGVSDVGHEWAGEAQKQKPNHREVIGFRLEFGCGGRI